MKNSVKKIIKNFIYCDVLKNSNDQRWENKEGREEKRREKKDRESWGRREKRREEERGEKKQKNRISTVDKFFVFFVRDISVFLLQNWRVTRIRLNDDHHVHHLKKEKKKKRGKIINNKKKKEKKEKKGKVKIIYMLRKRDAIYINTRCINMYDENTLHTL